MTRVLPLYPSLDEIDAITRIDSGAPNDLDRQVLRNLQVTQGYFELSRALGVLTNWGSRVSPPRLFGIPLGSSLAPQNMNWCTLAVWASKSVGYFIQDQELSFVNVALKYVDRALDTNGALQAFFSTLEKRTGAFLGEGNRVVFKQVGETVSGFMTEFKDASSPDYAHLERYLDRVLPNDELPLPDQVTFTTHAEEDGSLYFCVEGTKRGGEKILRQMLRAYYEAIFETDAKRRAELILLGNGYCGVHEQTRLQTYIAQGFQFGQEDIIHQLVAQFSGSPEQQRRFEEGLDCAIESAGALFMALELPRERIRVANGLRLGFGLPPDLRRVVEPELLAVLTQYDALDPGIRLSNPLIDAFDGFDDLFGILGRPILPRPSLLIPFRYRVAASNWTLLESRMKLILTLFRQHAQDPSLFDAPYSDGQVAAIKRGIIPGDFRYQPRNRTPSAPRPVPTPHRPAPSPVYAGPVE